MSSTGSPSTPTTGPSSADPGAFRPGILGWLILLRSLPGLAAVALSLQGRLWAAGAFLVLAVWADVALGWLASQRKWVKGNSQKQIEGFTDFLCFLWAPVQFTVALCPHPVLWALAPVFILAGAFRLARFNVEGLVGGRYRGLPVTYNGYLFPLAALASHYLFPRATPFLFGGLFLLLALLMATSTLRIPEA
jgi:CDP-diacylglycerol--serine O-phosphatidyltransferase